MNVSELLLAIQGERETLLTERAHTTMQVLSMPRIGNITDIATLQQLQQPLDTYLERPPAQGHGRSGRKGGVGYPLGGPTLGGHRSTPLYATGGSRWLGHLAPPLLQNFASNFCIVLTLWVPSRGGMSKLCFTWHVLSVVICTSGGTCTSTSNWFQVVTGYENRSGQNEQERLHLLTLYFQTLVPRKQLSKEPQMLSTNMLQLQFPGENQSINQTNFIFPPLEGRKEEKKQRNNNFMKDCSYGEHK